jgi:hypothetical protein
MERHERIGKIIANKGRETIIVETEDGELYELPRMSVVRKIGENSIFDFHDAKDAKRWKESV